MMAANPGRRAAEARNPQPYYLLPAPARSLQPPYLLVTGLLLDHQGAGRTTAGEQSTCLLQKTGISLRESGRNTYQWKGVMSRRNSAQT
jgi:hypothetical protein